jgi:hypothetical protein
MSLTHRVCDLWFYSSVTVFWGRYWPADIRKRRDVVVIWCIVYVLCIIFAYIRTHAVSISVRGGGRNVVCMIWKSERKWCCCVFASAHSWGQQVYSSSHSCLVGGTCVFCVLACVRLKTSTLHSTVVTSFRGYFGAVGVSSSNAWN